MSCIHPETVLGPNFHFFPLPLLHFSFNEKNLNLIVLTVCLLIKDYLLMVIATILYDDQYNLPGFFLFISLGWIYLIKSTSDYCVIQYRNKCNMISSWLWFYN